MLWIILPTPCYSCKIVAMLVLWQIKWILDKSISPPILNLNIIKLSKSLVDIINTQVMLLLNNIHIAEQWHSSWEFHGEHAPLKLHTKVHPLHKCKILIAGNLHHFQHFVTLSLPPFWKLAWQHHSASHLKFDKLYRLSYSVSSKNCKDNMCCWPKVKVSLF